MEEAAQRIRRLARDLCPGEPLGEKRCGASGISAFAATGTYPDSGKCSESGFHLYQSTSRRHGRFEKKVLSPSEEHGADGTPNFIWSPHLIEIGEFEAQLLKKNQTSISQDVEEKILSMYAKGMTTGDIETHIRDIYGLEVSDTTVSRITDKILPVAKEWQQRPLESVYAVAFLDANYHVRSEGQVVKKAVYIAIGVNLDGRKDVVGMWVGENESAKYWATILNGLRKRHGRKFCVGDNRQSQEWRCGNSAESGELPLHDQTPGSGPRYARRRRECRGTLPGILPRGEFV